MPAPESFFEIRELAEQASCRCALQNLHSISNRNRWRNTQKQMYVIRLNLFRYNRPSALLTDRIQSVPSSLGNRAYQYVVAILRTPDRMVRCLMDAVPNSLLRKPVIPLPTEVRSFLTEVL